MKMKRLPPIDAKVVEDFDTQLKKAHGGHKWRVKRQELENAIRFYCEQGALADEVVNVNSTTTTQSHKIKLTTEKFFEYFDNSDVYLYDVVPTDYLKRIIAEITVKEVDNGYNWQKYSKLLRDTGRVTNRAGTKFWEVNRKNLTKIEPELKAQYDLELESIPEFDFTPDEATTVYDKLPKGKRMSLFDFIKASGKSEDEAKKLIDDLKGRGLCEHRGFGTFILNKAGT